ncbi:MAG: cytochrome c biogenesis protein CcdA, partial [bacterium]
MMTRACRYVIDNLWKPALLAGLLLALISLLSNPSAGSESTLQGQAESIPVPVTFKARLDPPSVRPGEEVRVVISMDIARGWHIYSLVPGADPSIPPTNIRWAPGVLKVNGPAYETNPIVTFDPVVEAVLGYHEKRARFYQNFSVPLQPEFAKHTLTGSIRYQACNERICLLPATKTIELSYTLEALPARETYTFMNRSIDNLPVSGSLLPSADSLASALSEGFWAFILLAVVMGMAAWLTPCVFPMIPVTVSYFSNQARRTNRNGVGLAVVFCLGIIVTYTLIGLVMAALVGAAAAIRLATNPWINIGIALLFTVFAFSLMGFFELQMPFGLTQKVDRISRRGNGILGVVLMGTAFTLTAFTCTVQFVGTLLVAAAYGQWLWPIIGMLVFSTVFALPFLFLALFPGWIQSVRNKSGTWMIRLKFMLGLLELVAVTKFLSNADLVWGWGLLNRTVVLGIWAILVLCMSLVVLGVFPVPGISTGIHRPWKWIPAVFLLTAVFYFSYGSIGRPLDNWTESYLPPAITRTGRPAVDVGKNALEKAAELTWHATLVSAFAQSQKDGKPVFVDFTGYTCINCRWMEKNTFSHPDVHGRFKNRFNLVRLYTDGGDNYLENQNLQVDRFKTIALPFYVILSPDDQVLAKTSG